MQIHHDRRPVLAQTSKLLARVAAYVGKVRRV